MLKYLLKNIKKGQKILGIFCLVLATVIILANNSFLFEGQYKIRVNLFWIFTVSIILLVNYRASYIQYLIDKPKGKSREDLQPFMLSLILTMATLGFTFWTLFPRINSEDELGFYTRNKENFRKVAAIGEVLLKDTSINKINFVTPHNSYWEVFNNQGNMVAETPEFAKRQEGDLIDFKYINCIIQISFTKQTTNFYFETFPNHYLEIIKTGKGDLQANVIQK